MFVEFDAVPFSPAGEQHVVCGATPAGFGAPVYVDGPERQPHDVFRRLLERYPRSPKGLKSASELKAAGLRASNLFRPDAYVLGPSQLVTIPGVPTGTGRTTQAWEETVHPPSPVYRADKAVPFSTRPHADEAQAVRREAIRWAQDVLDDPDTVILAVSAIGSPAPSTPPLERAVPYEIALTSTSGRKRWHQFINPGWETIYLEQLRLGKGGLAVLESAPLFREVADTLLRRIQGKRVVIYGRNLQYAAIYAALEYAWLGDGLPYGALWPGTADTLTQLERSRWECARLRHGEFDNDWDAAEGHFALPVEESAADALSRCRMTAALLRRMADPALRYAELNARAERAVRDGKSHRPRSQGGQRLSRIAASRHAVLERSQGACENPRCPDPRYTSALGRNGSYLLEVDHIDDHAKGGDDLPRAMIALCPNCHALKTRGTVADSFRDLLRATALVRHQELLTKAR
ncbi:HNH endonuclease signature motif containing protein [Streptomyces coeruleorubidus]|uniref:HNH endonuclease signature motif containing protein n=1 Tax=Streptomyces coeruleorubidus TaxID=116188 RepID=UPI0033C28695